MGNNQSDFEEWERYPEPFWMAFIVTATTFLVLFASLGSYLLIFSTFSESSFVIISCMVVSAILMTICIWMIYEYSKHVKNIIWKNFKGDIDTLTEVIKKKLDYENIGYHETVYPHQYLFLRRNVLDIGDIRIILTVISKHLPNVRIGIGPVTMVTGPVIRSMTEQINNMDRPNG